MELESDMNLSASFSFELKHLMPELIIADYTRVEGSHRAMVELGLEPDEGPDSPGWMAIGRMHPILRNNDEQFEDIAEDDEGYKCFVWGVDDSLRGAQASVIEGFDDEIAGHVKHKINGSTEEFELALKNES